MPCAKTIKSIEAQRLLGTTALSRIRQLQDDPTVWDLQDIQRALKLTDRSSTSKLSRATRNYTHGGGAAWPPEKTRAASQDTPAAEGPVAWWPSHPSVLPPPDVSSEESRPRWRAGTIRRWAMRVGRMDLHGVPKSLTGRGNAPRRRETSLDIATVDYSALTAMTGDQQMWDIDDIRRFFAVNSATAHNWYRSCRSLWSGGLTEWPPSDTDIRRTRFGDEDGGLWWPAHFRVLPPPDRIDTGGKERWYGRGQDRWLAVIQFRWKAGTIKAWGLKVGRLNLDGTPNSLL